MPLGTQPLDVQKFRQAVISAYCYIERSRRRQGLSAFVRGATGVELHPDRLDLPLRWRKPRRIFVNSLSDLFHEDIPDEFIDRVFAVMALTPQHTYQVLTKRPERMRAYMTRERTAHFSDGTPVTPRNPYQSADFVIWAAQKMVEDLPLKEQARLGEEAYPTGDSFDWPLPNVWLGVTCENQRFADERIPILLDTTAAVRFVSLEPLLGAIDLSCWLPFWFPMVEASGPVTTMANKAPLNWVICGGESGGPEYRRLVERCNCRIEGWGRGSSCEICYGTGWCPKPSALTWVRSLRDQCVAASVPFFWKQWGGPKPKSGGRILDGREWDEYPAAC
mgnify:CR=1 FL=1